MVLNNIFDYVDQENTIGFKFWIPDWEDETVQFPFMVEDKGIIVDKHGAPAMFTIALLDSIYWDTWEEPKPQEGATDVNHNQTDDQ